MVLSGLGQLPRALEDCRRAVAIAPTNAIADNALAAVLLRAERPKEALGPAQRAIALDPQLMQAYANLGTDTSLLTARVTSYGDNSICAVTRSTSAARCRRRGCS
jgi:Flp pilus assembly protein TadD